MSGISLDPEGDTAKQLKVSLTKTLQTLDLSEDADYVAEFIIVLISNNRSPVEITNELSSLFGNAISESFIINIFKDLERLSNPEPAQPTQSSVRTQPQAAQSNSTRDQFSLSRAPTEPRGFNARSTNGINKNDRHTNTRNKSFALKNGQNFERAINLSMKNGNDRSTTFQTPFIQKKGKGRCHQFPYCKDRECTFAHPTKNCFAFPNCSNPPGTCNYLHPGEDDALIAELEKSNQKFNQKKQNLGTIGICKFGILCQKKLCPFGHPTPANNDAKVIVLEWCADSKNCHDSSCQKAHPSPEYKPESMEAEPAEKSLENCKFGSSCMNLRCPRRHATSPVVCRDGFNCERIDCYFTHPIKEGCRYGINCKNRNCPFQHPAERAELIDKPLVWSRDGAPTYPSFTAASASNHTSQRQFAVPEDQIMEQAPPQEG